MMGKFERYLSIWVGLAMVGGLVGGLAQPTLFAYLGQLEYANINFVIAGIDLADDLSHDDADRLYRH